MLEPPIIEFIASTLLTRTRYEFTNKRLQKINLCSPLLVNVTQTVNRLSMSIHRRGVLQDNLHTGEKNTEHQQAPSRE